MPFDLVDAGGSRYRLPASLQPAQLHVGGAPRIRFIRGYGSPAWFVALDGIREPEALNIVGLLATDRNDAQIEALVDALETAAASAVRLDHVDHLDQPTRSLPLLGALPITTEPDGIDGTLLKVTLPLIPGAERWAVGGDSSG